MANGVRFGELGITGLDEYNGYVTEQWVADLRTNSQRVKVWDEISRLDPTGAAIMSMAAMFMRQADIRAIPASMSAQDLSAAEFLESCLHDMSKSFPETMADIVQFLAYGFFDAELVYKRRDGKKSQFSDGRIGWRKWAPRHPVTLGYWALDRNGGLQGMWQQTDMSMVFIPIKKLLHFTTTGAGKNNPEGRSIFEGGYTSWFFAKNLRIQTAIVIERMSGTPVIVMPEGATMDATDSNSDLSRAKKVVRLVKVGDDMGMTLPAGWEFKYEMPQGTPPVDPLSTILHHQRDMARVLMADFILLGGGDQGSWAMHKDKSGLFVKGINGYLRQIASVINRHGVPRLFDVNAFSGLSALPEVHFTPITKIDIGDFAEVVSSLFNSGAITYDLETELAVRRQAGLPEIEEPGLLLKPNLPAQPPATAIHPEIPASASTPKKEKEEEEEELSDLTTFTESIPYSDAVDYVKRIGRSLVRDYDRLVSTTISELNEAKTEDEWADIVDSFLSALSRIMRGRLRMGMLHMWDLTTESDPSTQGLGVITAELANQERFMEDKLNPAVRKATLELMHRLRDDGADDAAVIMALRGTFSTFRHRVGSYSGSIYKIHANHGKALAILDDMQPAIQKSGADISLDWSRGTLMGLGVVARYHGPDDTRTCPECADVVGAGWMGASAIPPIGSLRCNVNCRHTIEYKFKRKVYR